MFRKRHGIFYLLNLSAELQPQQENKGANLIIIEATLIRRRLLHRLLEVVADLAESMVGLRFLFLFIKDS